MYSSNSSSPSLRHLVFFEALAGLKESDAEWRTTSAGLVVLRLFDSWMDEGEVVLQDNWGMSAVREAIDAVDTGTPVRSLLNGIVDAMTNSPVPEIAIVGPRLLAYGRALDIAGRWKLAADVYRSIIAHTDPVEDSDIAIDANMQLGYCSAMLSEWEVASAAYGLAGQIAEASSDIVKVLRARLADAKLMTDLGNLPGAESVLDEAIRRASHENVGDVKGLLKHQRASVAFLRGEYERSIGLAYEALVALQSPAARDRALADLAAAFAELGCRTAARDAHLILAATAQEQYTRWMATINLMELASFDMREPNFEQHRRELADSALPPSLAAAYYLYVGQGYQRFRKFDMAEQAIEHAIEIANSHKLNQLLFQAEAALVEVRTGRSSQVPPAIDPAPSVREIAESIREMRMAAGASVG
jgi:tetratricopeptide (TPR) repeat protein